MLWQERFSESRFWPYSPLVGRVVPASGFGRSAGTVGMLRWGLEHVSAKLSHVLDEGV